MSMDDPDLVLVNAASRGDVDAFESLVGRYQGPLLNFIARTLGDRATAEDLAQEVFLRVYRAAPRFEARTKVSTWVFRIAYNLAMTELDRRKRRRTLAEALHRNGKEASREALADPGEDREFQEEIASALDGLPGNQRAVLLLRLHQDLSYREIAEVLGTSVGSVESLLFRARKTLRESLGRRKQHGGTK